MEWERSNSAAELGNKAFKSRTPFKMNRGHHTVYDTATDVSEVTDRLSMDKTKKNKKKFQLFLKNPLTNVGECGILYELSRRGQHKSERV